MARNPYITEPATMFDTFVQTSGVVFMFGGMLIGHWLVDSALAGFIVGVVSFAALVAFYVSTDRKQKQRSTEFNGAE